MVSRTHTRIIMKERESCVRQDNRSLYEDITEVFANNEQRKEFGSNEKKIQEKFRTLHINQHEICIRNILQVMQLVKVRYDVAHIMIRVEEECTQVFSKNFRAECIVLKT
jgi:hypothetical protein